MRKVAFPIPDKCKSNVFGSIPYNCNFYLKDGFCLAFCQPIEDGKPCKECKDAEKDVKPWKN